MRKSLERAVIIAVVGVLTGLLWNAISPRGIPYVTPPKKQPKAEEFIELAKAKALWDGGSAIFIDAREPVDFAAGHIATALNLPVLEFDKHYGELAPRLSTEAQIIAYCDGTECELSHRLQTRLREAGYTNVHILFNGWTAWRQAGHPTEQGEGK